MKQPNVVDNKVMSTAASPASAFVAVKRLSAFALPIGAVVFCSTPSTPEAGDVTAPKPSLVVLAVEKEPPVLLSAQHGRLYQHDGPATASTFDRESLGLKSGPSLGLALRQHTAKLATLVSQSAALRPATGVVASRVSVGLARWYGEAPSADQAGFGDRLSHVLKIATAA